MKIPRRFRHTMRSAGLACLAANLVVAVGLTVQSMPASAAGAYPDKAVKLVVAWPPGGTADFFGREIASNLQQQLANLSSSRMSPAPVA